MRLNLGCGQDQRVGYTNVDFVQPCDQIVDLSRVPWPWADNSVEEILMLDFLEHFPYNATEKILQECWRILKPHGRLEVQVPDFDHCAMAAMQIDGSYLCNRCGNKITLNFRTQEFGGVKSYDEETGTDFWECSKCGQELDDISKAAIHRLYGGQDRPGNWHFTAFPRFQLKNMLQTAGFYSLELLEHDHQYANWNVKFGALKGDLKWSEE